MSHKIHIIIIFLILSIAFLLRFYKLGEIPAGFYQDESAIGYNAYSVMETGKDEHGQTFPLYFKSFGDYKLPVYIYLTALSVQTFGLNEFAVRFPSALFGFLTVVVFYFFVKELTRNKPLSIISTAFLAISPWHLHYNRATFEVSISLFLFVLGGLFLYKSFHNKTRYAFLVGTVCFVISFYSYNLARVFAPALYFLFLIFNKSQVSMVSKKEQLLTVIVVSILFIPFFTTLFQSGGIASAEGTLIFSSKAVQAPHLEFRSYFVDLPPLVTKLFLSHLPLTLWQYLQNIISSFDPSFFFVSGSSHGNHGIGNVGQLYLFQFPLVLLGVITVVLEKPRWSKFLILWALVSIFVVSLTREVPHATRSFFLIVPFEIFYGLGVLAFFVWLGNIKKLRYKIGVLVLCMAFVIYSILFYFASYYVRFPILYARQWRAQDKEVALYIKENHSKYSKIIFDSESGYAYSSLLFYLKYEPEEFQKSVVWYDDDSEGFSMPKSFGKFEFRAIDWNKDVQRKTLIITAQDRKPKEIPKLREFFYPQRPVVLSIKQNIVFYPIKETAYVVVAPK
ncbi:MAG: glycosyltransferase family 39 protein [Patescibacteria group bacterium]